jgi:prephenate dehydrogenase
MANLRENVSQADFQAKTILRGAACAILGAGGGMGRLLARQAQRAGVEIISFNRTPAKGCLPFAAAGGVLPECKIILCCLPETALSETLQILRPWLRQDQVLADITSLKSQAMSIMAATHPGPVVGTHPLFGPKARFTGKGTGLSSGLGRRVAIVPGARAQTSHVALVEAFFESMGCQTFLCSAREHDRAMAMMQGLNFLDQLAFLSIASTVSRLDNFITPSFKRRLNAAKKFLHQDAELFTGLAGNNPYVQEMGEVLLSELHEVLQGNTQDALTRARSLFRKQL